MRIGILTLPLHTNYGGILQAYALQETLKLLGNEVWILDPSPLLKIPAYKKPFSYLKRAIRRIFLNTDDEIFFDVKYNREFKIISEHTEVFLKRKINRLEINDLYSVPKEFFDVLVVGSDQIWRPKYYPKIENAFLKFAKKWEVKRIAYAPSFGVDKWEYNTNDTLKCKELITLFHSVSVREDSGVKLVEEYFGRSAVHVADPTLLLPKEKYIELFKEADIPLSKGNFLTYILDLNSDIENLISEIECQCGLKAFKCNSEVENPKAKLNARIQPPVEQWIRGFYDAEFVLTDSFHACIFAIIFNKPFVVIGNRNRGLARFLSVLKKFGLEERLIYDPKDFDITMVSTPLNGQIEQRLEQFKEFSLNFLTNSLKS